MNSMAPTWTKLRHILAKIQHLLHNFEGQAAWNLAIVRRDLKYGPVFCMWFIKVFSSWAVKDSDFGRLW